MQRAPPLRALRRCEQVLAVFLQKAPETAFTAITQMDAAEAAKAAGAGAEADQGVRPARVCDALMMRCARHLLATAPQ
eukprot:COSAG01_NODE_10554_length_2134_cov_1.374447_1_plen_78_part_00